jgi:hypothetical protein
LPQQRLIGRERRSRLAAASAVDCSAVREWLLGIDLQPVRWPLRRTWTINLRERSAGLRQIVACDPMPHF